MKKMKKKIAKAKKAVKKDQVPELLTESVAQKYPELYMVFMNLSGCHEKVYTMKYDNDDGMCPMWYDRVVDYCLCVDDKKCIGWNIEDGIAEYITPNKEEAENILKGIQTYIEMLKARL